MLLATVCTSCMHECRRHAAGLDEAKLFRVLRLAVAQNLLAGSTDRSGRGPLPQQRRVRDAAGGPPQLNPVSRQHYRASNSLVQPNAPGSDQG
jgi:hypothetical protein